MQARTIDAASPTWRVWPRNCRRMRIPTLCTYSARTAGAIQGARATRRPPGLEAGRPPDAPGGLWPDRCPGCASRRPGRHLHRTCRCHDDPSSGICDTPLACTTSKAPVSTPSSTGSTQHPSTEAGSSSSFGDQRSTSARSVEEALPRSRPWADRRSLGDPGHRKDALLPGRPADRHQYPAVGGHRTRSYEMADRRRPAVRRSRPLRGTPAGRQPARDRDGRHRGQRSAAYRVCQVQRAVRRRGASLDQLAAWPRAPPAWTQCADRRGRHDPSGRRRSTSLSPHPFHLVHPVSWCTLSPR